MTIKMYFLNKKIPNQAKHNNLIISLLVFYKILKNNEIKTYIYNIDCNFKF